MKRKIFQSSIKKYAIAIALVYILYAIILYYGVTSVYSKLPANDSMKLPYLIAIMSSGVIMVLSTVIAMFLNINKFIIFTPMAIEYRHGNRDFKVTWRDLVFKPPERNRKLFRWALVSNGKIFGTIDNIFFPEFETMVKVIDMAKDIKGSGTIEL